MNFESELISGVLIKRYKRFFVDIKVKNKIITAHCPNSGSMMGLLKKGNKVWFTESQNQKRKLKYTIQIIEVDGNKVGVNTKIMVVLNEDPHDLSTNGRRMLTVRLVINWMPSQRLAKRFPPVSFLKVKRA